MYKLKKSTLNNMSVNSLIEYLEKNKFYLKDKEIEHIERLIEIEKAYTKELVAGLSDEHSPCPLYRLAYTQLKKENKVERIKNYGRETWYEVSVADILVTMKRILDEADKKSIDLYRILHERRFDQI